MNFGEPSVPALGRTRWDADEMLKMVRRSIERHGDNVNFVSSDGLRGILDQTDATDAQVEEAVQINEEARRRALKLGLLLLAGISAIAIVPASGLPRY